MRTVLKYPGSKWNIARQLVDMIPEHHSYVEPFFGSGAVLFNMEMSITMLDMCDAIYMLDGWQQSCGANREYGYALAKDKIILKE